MICIHCSYSTNCNIYVRQSVHKSFSQRGRLVIGAVREENDWEKMCGGKKSGSVKRLGGV